MKTMKTMMILIYNPAIIALLAEFGCKARDMSGERGGKAGENIDIKLWRGENENIELFISLIEDFMLRDP